MELGKPKFRLGAMELSSWETEGNYRKAFQRKVMETLTMFPWTFIEPGYREKEAGLYNLLLLSQDNLMTGVTIEESQDNEWNQTMRGAKINWANPPTVQNGLVPGHHPCEHQAPSPCPALVG